MLKRENYNLDVFMKHLLCKEERGLRFKTKVAPEIHANTKLNRQKKREAKFIWARLVTARGYELDDGHVYSRRELS